MRRVRRSVEWNQTLIEDRLHHARIHSGGELAVWSVGCALQAASGPDTRSSSITLAKLMRETNAAPPLLR